MAFPSFSYGFPLVFLSFSDDFPIPYAPCMGYLPPFFPKMVQNVSKYSSTIGSNHGFSIIFLWFSHDFPGILGPPRSLPPLGRPGVGHGARGLQPAALGPLARWRTAGASGGEDHVLRVFGAIFQANFG